MNNGLLLVICGPSGVGKGTIIGSLFKSNINVEFSVSATTRSPRVNEVDGEDYYFKTVDEFKNMIDNDGFVEWTEYCDNYYGTTKKEVERLTESGKDVIFDIEINGALNIKKQYPDSVLIFIMPPSIENLKERIVGRGTETADVIEKRLERAEQDMQYVDRFDYVVVNDEVDKAVNKINCIINAEKCSVKRN